MTLLERTNLIINAVGEKSDKIVLPLGPGESSENPLLIMSASILYGSYFRCHKCNQIGRSTVAFDCYGEVGELLTCELCQHNLKVEET